MFIQVLLSTTISKFLSYNNNKKCKPNKFSTFFFFFNEDTCREAKQVFNLFFFNEDTCREHSSPWGFVSSPYMDSFFVSISFHTCYLFPPSINRNKTGSLPRNFRGIMVQITLTMLFPVCERKYYLFL